MWDTTTAPEIDRRSCAVSCSREVRFTNLLKTTNTSSSRVCGDQREVSSIVLLCLRSFFVLLREKKLWFLLHGRGSNWRSGGGLESANQGPGIQQFLREGIGNSHRSSGQKIHCVTIPFVEIERSLSELLRDQGQEPNRARVLLVVVASLLVHRQVARDPVEIADS